MIAHNFPKSGAATSIAGHGFACASSASFSSGAAAAVPTPDEPGRVKKERHGPVRVPLHVASGCEGPGVDPGRFPCGPRPRRLRGPLLLPDTGSAGARCRGQRPLGGHRSADCAVPALCGGARTVLGGSLWHQRGVEDRRRGEGDPDRSPEIPCRNRRCRRVCWSWSQVSDLGTRTLPRRARRGHSESSRAQEAVEFPGGGGWPARSTGMTAGSDSGTPAVSGGLARHIPVLVHSVIELLAVREGGIYVDATFGAGG